MELTGLSEILLWTLLSAAALLVNTARPRGMGVFYKHLGHADRDELAAALNQTLLIHAVVFVGYLLLRRPDLSECECEWSLPAMVAGQLAAYTVAMFRLR